MATDDGDDCVDCVFNDDVRCSSDTGLNCGGDLRE